MQYKTSSLMAAMASVLFLAPIAIAIPAPMEEINANWEIATSWQKRDLQKRNLVGVITDSVPRDAGIPGASIMSSNIDEPDLGLFQTMMKWIGSEKVGVMKENSEKQCIFLYRTRRSVESRAENIVWVEIGTVHDNPELFGNRLKTDWQTFVGFLTPRISHLESGFAATDHPSDADGFGRVYADFGTSPAGSIRGVGKQVNIGGFDYFVEDKLAC